MTDQTPPPGWQPGQENPKAAAKAAKAYAKATRPWFKKKRFIIPIAFVAIMVIIQASSGGGSDGPEKVASGGDKTSSSDSKKVGTKSNPIKIGETIKLEGTQYTVKSVKTAADVGSEFFKETADGKYVIIDLTIENKKNETKTFSDSAAKFVTTDGKSYSADTDATVALMGTDGQPLFLEEMQPDLPKTGKLVFDVPPGKIKGGLLEVSDLFGGGEAYITLGLK